MKSETIDRVQEFIDWLSIASSPNTCAAYEWELRALERFYPDRQIETLQTADLARYVSHRRVIQKCADATVRRSVNALKVFYRYCAGDKKSPAASLPMPTLKKKRQRSLSWEQVDRLLLACDTSRPRGKRDLALVCLLLDSGLRASEICRLKLDDVDMAERRLTVQIKGGNDGDGIFGPETQQALAMWLSIRQNYALPGVRNFFVSIGGDKPGTALTSSGLRVIFRRLAKDAGFDKLSPHDLRRSFATLSSRLGAPTRVLQVAGRWEDIQQVVQYTRTLEADDFAQYSPVSHVLRTKLG